MRESCCDVVLVHLLFAAPVIAYYEFTSEAMRFKFWLLHASKANNESFLLLLQVALSHDEGSSQIMVSAVFLQVFCVSSANFEDKVNPNPMQWGRAAACSTFDLGGMKRFEQTCWCCSHGHSLWPVLLMPDERYAGGWACDVCDRSSKCFVNAL
jgi:hypothetical protein